MDVDHGHIVNIIDPTIKLKKILEEKKVFDNGYRN